MPFDLRRLYAELGNVDPVTLPAPETLRGRADRRARSLVAVACVAVALLVSGTAFAINAAFDRTLAPPVPGATASSVPSPLRPSPVVGPVSIPDTAFFNQPVGRKRWEPSTVDEAEKGLGLARLCGAAFPSNTAIGIARGDVQYIFAETATADGIPEMTVGQVIALYESGAAMAAMDQVRAAVAGCSHDTNDDGASLDYTILATTTRSDDTILIHERWSRPGSELPPAHSFAMVVRMGETITVLRFATWEGGNVDRTTVEAYTDLAVAAIRAWRG